MYKVLKDKNYTETSRINEDEFSKLCPALYALFVSQIKEKAAEESVEHEDKLSTGECEFVLDKVRYTCLNFTRQ